MPERRLHVHLGLQKTGTSFLQDVLLSNRQDLAAQGLDLVPPTKREAFELMLLVRDRYHAGRDPESVLHSLTRFTAQLAEAPGPRALLSQESLAAARPAQIQRFLDAAGDREVHVVLTVRDLGRQLPSTWQQEVKAGRTQRYRRYLRRLQRQEQAGRGGHPWIHLDPATVLSRWSEALSPERIHVVTVPPAGSSPTLLLERFCRVLGIDPERLVLEERPRNTSLGRVQAEVLRRVNADLPDDLRRRQVYGDVGKRFLAGQVLGQQDPRPIRIPTQLREWCEEVTARQTAALAAAGYHVEGSLEELRPTDDAFSDDDRKPSEREVAAAAVSALSQVLALRAQGPRPKGSGPARTASRMRRLVGRRRRPRRGAGSS